MVSTTYTPLRRNKSRRSFMKRKIHSELPASNAKKSKEELSNDGYSEKLMTQKNAETEHCDVEVLNPSDKMARLVKIAEIYGHSRGKSSPSARRLLVVGGTKVSCDNIVKGLSDVLTAGVAQAAHNGVTKEARAHAIAQFLDASNRCRILVSTHTLFTLPTDGTVHALITFDFPQEGIAYYTARVARARELGCVMHTFFTYEDGRNARALVGALRARKSPGHNRTNLAIPEALLELDRGEFGSLSNAELRRGLVRIPTDLTSVGTPTSPVAASNPLPAVLTAAFRGNSPKNDGKLHLLYCVSGTPHDRATPAAFASWVPPDSAFKHRRDALARCVVAALWARPPWPGANNPNSPLVGVGEVYSDTECWLLFTERVTWQPSQSSYLLLRLTADFARGVGEAAHEQAVLTHLDKAVRGLPVEGATRVWAKDVPALARAMFAEFQAQNLNNPRFLMAELHDRWVRQLGCSMRMACVWVCGCVGVCAASPNSCRCTGLLLSPTPLRLLRSRILWWL